MPMHVRTRTIESFFIESAVGFLPILNKVLAERWFFNRNEIYRQLRHYY